MSSWKKRTANRKPREVIGFSVIIDLAENPDAVLASGCTCTTSLEDDAYEPGGPMSGRPRPPLCTLHPNQDGKLTTRNMSSGPIKD